LQAEKRRGALPDNETVSPEKVIKLRKHDPVVREGDF
jgi:hypothetical protein